MANRYLVTGAPCLESNQDDNKLSASNTTQIKDVTQNTEQSCACQIPTGIDENGTKKWKQAHPATISTSLHDATEKLLTSTSEIEACSEEDMEALHRLEQALKILARGAVRAAQKQKAGERKTLPKQPKMTDSAMSDYRTSAGISVVGERKTESMVALNSLPITHSAIGTIAKAP